MIKAAIDYLIEQEDLEWYVDNNRDPAGASLRGTITTTFDELVDKLGSPVESGVLAQDRRVYWIVSWEDGSFAMIYDYNKGHIPVKEVTEWNVASKHSGVVDRLEEIFGE